MLKADRSVKYAKSPDNVPTPTTYKRDCKFKDLNVAASRGHQLCIMMRGSGLPQPIAPSVYISTNISDGDRSAYNRGRTAGVRLTIAAVS